MHFNTKPKSSQKFSTFLSHIFYSKHTCMCMYVYICITIYETAKFSIASNCTSPQTLLHHQIFTFYYKITIFLAFTTCTKRNTFKFTTNNAHTKTNRISKYRLKNISKRMQSHVRLDTLIVRHIFHFISF